MEQSRSASAVFARVSSLLNDKRSSFSFVLITAVMLACVPVAQVQGQGSRQSLSPFETAQQAFEALPEARRKEIQDGLVWAGHYKGAIDGEFGRMTMRAIQAYEARGRARPDGVLSPHDITALAREANRRKQTIKFQIVSEPRAGVKIGVPEKFVKRSNNKDGSLFAAPDRSLLLRTFKIPESRQTLRELFDVLRAPARGRRVSYKVLRDDFLVVAVESRSRFSYTRVARVPASSGADGAAVLRGFSFSIAQSLRRKRREQADILTIAISNSFDPSPEKTANNAQAASASSAGTQQSGEPKEFLAATALAIAPDTYLTVLPEGQCRTVRIGKAPARPLSNDKASGLALFSAPVGGGAPASYRYAKALTAGPAFGLFAELPFPGANPQISLARGALARGASAGAQPLLRAQIIMPASATGGAIVTAGGDLAGLVAPGNLVARKVAGPIPRLSRALIAPAQITAFLAGAGVKNAPFTARTEGNSPAVDPNASKTAASVASLFARSLTPVWCQK